MDINKRENLEMYDRSRRFAKVVEATGAGPIRLAVTIDPEIAGTETAQVLALALCNILPRMSERYTQIDLCVPKHSVRIPRVKTHETLSEYLLREVNAVCPWGRFHAVEKLTDVYDYCIVVGKTTPLTAKHAIYALASGWRCFVSGEPLVWPSLKFNPCSCLATAALASMFVFRHAEQIHSWVRQPKINGWSLLSYQESAQDGPDLPSQLDVDEVRQAGVGGTGNALLWALSYGPKLIGKWIAFEHESVDVTNWNRYLLLKFIDAFQQKPKADIATQAFEKIHPGLNFAVMPDRVEDFYRTFQRATAVLATVDDPKVRVDLQQHSKNILLNVGTNSQMLSISVHDTRKIIEGGACVGCLYGENQQAERRHREATVSFVLALAGAALCGEFIKSYAFPEHLLDDSWGPANIFYPAAAKTLHAFKDPLCSVCGVLEKTMREISSGRRSVIRTGTEAQLGAAIDGK